jgi:dephospho-CoA kinase
MIRVGITGTVGAGKSTVGRMFEEWGAVRVDADELAREAVRPGSAALEAIRREWGDEVLDEEGGLDRAAMREVVFGDPEARERLESIVHPEVRRLREERMEEARAAGADVVVSEVPLLLETGMEGDFDVLVVVDAPREERLRRVRRERGVEASTFEAIEAAQWSGARKRERGDRVIVNDGSLEELRDAARRVWEVIRGRGGDE